MKVEQQILEMSVVIHTMSTYKNSFCSSLFGCEKWFPILREEHKLEVSERPLGKFWTCEG